MLAVQFLKRQPRSMSELAGPASTLPRRRGARTRRDCVILIVDPDPAARHAIAAEVRRMHIQVALAGDALEAFQAVRRTFFDIAFIELDLPAIDGFRASGAIASMQHPPPAMVALSGSDDESLIALCKQRGMQSLLRKPIPPGKIRSEVARWLVGLQA
jgi:two-component system, sensor histidine kinase and response regulator